MPLNVGDRLYDAFIGIYGTVIVRGDTVALVKWDNGQEEMIFVKARISRYYKQVEKR